MDQRATLPRKEAKSLLALSLSATTELVLASAEKISSNFPSRLRCSLDVDGCKEEVQKLQDFLRLNLPRTLWEPLFHSVVQEISTSLFHHRDTNIKDYRIIYNTFFYQNVDIKKLVINSSPTWASVLDYKHWSEEGFTPDEVLQIRERHDMFWMQSARMLTKLEEVKVDFELPSTTFNREVVLAFCHFCPQLRVFSSLPFLPVELMKEVIASGTNLQNYVNFNSYNIDECLFSLPPDRKLKFRWLSIEGVTPEQFRRALDLCPDVQELTNKLGKSEEITQILISRPHRFSKLNITYDAGIPNAVNNLLVSKGEFLRELNIRYDEDSKPLLNLRVVGETCPNLTSLSVTVECQVDEGAAQNWARSTTFPKLERLEIYSWSFNGPLILSLLKLATVDSVNLKEVCIYACEAAPGNIVAVEEAFLQLLTTNQRMKQLRKLEFVTNGDEIPLSLAKAVNESCVHLTHLVFGTLTQEAKEYYDKVRQEVKLKNCDMFLKYYHHLDEFFAMT